MSDELDDDQRLFDTELRLGGAISCKTCANARPNRCCVCGYLSDELEPGEDLYARMCFGLQGTHLFCPGCRDKLDEDANDAFKSW